MKGLLDRVFGSIAQSLSTAPAPAPKRPDPTPEERRLLQSAAQWLDAATLAHARAFALGEERTYDADQDEGLLRFLFPDGRELPAQFQILASFQPANRSFRWSWANASVAPTMSDASRRARDHVEVAGVASFHAKGFETSFDDAQNLAAAAARLAGCDGAYRCIADRSLSIFAGFTAPTPPTDWFRAPRPAPDFEAAAIALVDSWNAEMIGFDRRWHEQRRVRGNDPSFMSELQAEQLDAYERHWSRTDDYWKPSSFGWPSDHDPREQLRRFALPRREGGVYVITQRRLIGADAHVVDLVDGAPRITDQDLDWGQGLMLARPEAQTP